MNRKLNIVIWLLLGVVIFAILDLGLIFSSIILDVSGIFGMILLVLVVILIILVIVLALEIRFRNREIKKEVEKIGFVKLEITERKENITTSLKKSGMYYLIMVFLISGVVLMFIEVFGFSFFKTYFLDMEITTEVLLHWFWINISIVLVIMFLMVLVSAYVYRNRESNN